MAQDEGRGFPHQYAQTRWAPAGMRPKVPRQVIRESSYVYAAVAPEQGLMTSLILPSANTATMNLFLAEAGGRLCRLLYRHASRSSGLAPGQRPEGTREYSLDLSTRLQSRGQSRRTSVGGTAREILAQSRLFLSGGTD